MLPLVGEVSPRKCQGPSKDMHQAWAIRIAQQSKQLVPAPFASQHLLSRHLANALRLPAEARHASNTLCHNLRARTLRGHTESFEGHHDRWTAVKSQLRKQRHRRMV